MLLNVVIILNISQALGFFWFAVLYLPVVKVKHLLPSQWLGVLFV